MSELRLKEWEKVRVLLCQIQSETFIIIFGIIKYEITQSKFSVEIN